MKSISTNLYTKAKLRNGIFIAITLILLPVSNLIKTSVTEKMLYGFLDKYESTIVFKDEIFAVTMLNNLDKTFYFILSALVWVAFAIVGVLLVKLIYHNHILEKRILRVTLIAYFVKLGSFLIVWGGSFVVKLIFPNGYFLDRIIMTQFSTPYYGFSWFNATFDIIFLLTIFIGFLYIYKNPFKQYVIRKLNDKAVTAN